MEIGLKTLEFIRNSVVNLLKLLESTITYNLKSFFSCNSYL